MKRISWVPGVALSGVTTVPVEILDDIFEFAAAEAVLKIPVSKTSMPLVLIFVCPRWRKIAVRNHRLWRRFCLDLSGTTRSWRLLDVLQKLGLARYISSVMVNRLGRFPVQIDVRWDHFLPNIDKHMEELIMELYDSSIMPFLFHGPDALDLKRLSLTFYPSQRAINWTDIFDTITTTKDPTVFLSMRNLRTLEMRSVVSSVGYALLRCQNIPWPQLLSFDIGFPQIDIEILRSCLSRCDSLEKLRLHFVDTGVSDLSKIKPLPKLKSVCYASTAAKSLHLLGISWKLLKNVQLKNSGFSPFSIPFTDLLSVLQDLENIETLDLDVLRRDDVIVKPDTRKFYLPHLWALRLRSLYPQILSFFKVPVLVDLTLVVPGGHTSLITPLSRMIKASLCSIIVFRCYELFNGSATQTRNPFEETEPLPDYLSYRQEHLLRVAKFLAKYMPRVGLVQGFTMRFDVKLMLKIAAGLALPRLQEIRCILPSSYVDLLLDIIEARAEGRGHRGRLWKVFVAIYGRISESTMARLDTAEKDLGVKFEKKLYSVQTLKVIYI